MVAEMVTNLKVQESMAQGLFVVGSGVDVAAVKAHLQDLVSVPVIAPEEPQLALARGAALASANAPRYDTSTIGLAYSQDPDGTTVYPMALADDATTFLGHDDASPDTADIASDPDDVPERRKPFLLVGGSLAAIFVAGLMALTIAMGSISANRGSRLRRHGVAFRRCGAACPAQSAPPAAPLQVPNTVPDPAPAAPPAARHRDGTAKGSARPRAASIRAQRCARSGCTATAPAAPPPVVFPPADTAAGHPVASPDCAATPLLQPAGEGAGAGGGHWRPRRWRARWHGGGD